MLPFLRRAVISGLVAGLAVAHLSLVGLVVKLDDRDLISGLLSLGVMIPIIAAYAGGFLAAGPLRRMEAIVPSQATAVLSGAVSGLFTGLLVAFMIWLIATVNVHGVLVNASPPLIKVLHLGLDAVAGSLALIGGGAALGLAGALTRVMPSGLRRGVLTGLVAVTGLALMQTFVGQILTGLGLKAVNSFLYARDGMKELGALVALVAFGVGGWAWTERKDAVRSRIREMPTAQRRSLRLAWLAVVLVIVITPPLYAGSFLNQALDLIGLYILLGLGLNIVVGFAGLLDLGYVAFYAVGAYATAVLTSPASPFFAPHIDFWVAVPIVMAVTALIGLTIGAPVLRLRGDYLAIVTLGFGEIARIIFLSDWMTPYVGGAQGILQIPAPQFFGISLRQPEKLYYPILAACILAAIAAISLARSRVGRAWTAMREDESVAEASGVNTTKYKLLAFSLGATFGGLAGALYAVRIGSVFPQDLNIVVSINALALIILGGIGSIPGVVIGAIVLVGLPEVLREFSEYRLLIYGIVLVAMMLLRPEGLLPNRSRRAELHEGEDEGEGEEEAWGKEAGAETPEPMIS
ncbi:MAG TPA: leucine/isoleucine/valine transporter permease subunit [Candidatus Limnocylindria bacterium]|nr:leucine/isoleucine/valine transporter permease subunit [Candidatus Limnocylindria bacterium]